MVRVICMATALMAGPAYGENWIVLKGPEVAAALSGATVTYDSASQVFYKSGRTLYDSGRSSWGYWEVRGDLYCSQWPPADGWGCYALERDTDDGRLRFVSGTGHATTGTIVE